MPTVRPLSEEEDPIFQSSPASKLTKVDVSNVKRLPVVISEIKSQRLRHGIDGRTPLKGRDYFTEKEATAFLKAATPIKGIHYRDGADGQKGERGDRGFPGFGYEGKAGKDGKDGRTPVAGVDFPLPKDGKDGRDGKDGKDGIDGVDGKDAVIDTKEVRTFAENPVKEHEKAYDHTLLHSPYTIGTKEIDESSIGDRKIPMYDAGVGKLVYAPLPKQTGRQISGGGTTLPLKKGNTGKFLKVHSDESLKWDEIDLSGYLTLDQSTPQSTLGTLIFPYFKPSTGYKSVDNTAGASATTGGLTFKNGLYTAGSAVAVAHDLLSSTHGDTVAASVVAGDILYGNATPKWARLAKGTDGHVLTLVGGLPAWAAAAGGAPGGSTTQMQYNNAGAFDGTTGLAWVSGSSQLKFNDNIYAAFGTGADTKLYTSSSNHFYIENDTSNADIFIKVNDGGVDTTMVQFDSSISRSIFFAPADIVNPFKVGDTSVRATGYSRTIADYASYSNTTASATPIRMTGLNFDVRNYRPFYSDYDLEDIVQANMWGVNAQVHKFHNISGNEVGYDEGNYGGLYDMWLAGTVSLQTDEGIHMYSYGTENRVTDNRICDGTTMYTYDYGGSYTCQLQHPAPEINGGTWYAELYGFLASVFTSGARPNGYSKLYGGMFNVNGANATEAWGIYVATFGTVHNFLGNDSVKQYLGTDKDASIYYSSTDLCLSPREVGSGVVNFVQAAGSAPASTTPAAWLDIKVNGTAYKLALYQ